MSEGKILVQVFCIDKRFDSMAADFFKGVGIINDNVGLFDKYYMVTTAGGGLSPGYSSYCSEKYNTCCSCESIESCDPENFDMKLLRDGIIKNIDISLTLDEISGINLLNHQDCGAIKAYLACSGYPETLGENNELEIEINTYLLKYAKTYMNSVYPDIFVAMLLMDINGTVAKLDFIHSSWNVIYRGVGDDPLGLWFDL